MADGEMGKAEFETRMWTALEEVRIGMLGAVGAATRHMQPMSGFSEPATRTIWFFMQRDNDLIAQAAAAGGAAMFNLVSKDRNLWACLGGALREDRDPVVIEGGGVSEAEVIVRVEDGVGRLSLNRPRALNALTTDMCVTVADALLAWLDDDAVRLVIVDHAGERGFCAGGDIRVVAASGAGDGAEARRFFAAEYRMNELLFRYPKPVAAIMDGITLGGGVGISMPARFRIATERTAWGMPEGDIGLFPDVGAGWSLPRLPGEVGTWLALTGARLRAADCRALGIATHFVESKRIGDLTGALASASVRNLEEILKRFATDPGPSPLAEHRSAIDRLFADDSVEAIVAALRADESEWALAQREVMARKCPTTLKVALRLVREGAARTSFAEEMAAEYRVAVRMSRRPDFIEGVRAVILDKDNAPRWSPAALEDVTPAMLDAIFAPLPPDEEWHPLP